ncbi:MAG: phospholipase D-like domain-containing protein [Rubrivivax sp.]
MRLQRAFRGRVPFAIAIALLTLAGTLIAGNFKSGEKRIEARIERLFSTDDPRFERELSLLLGPPLIAGNRIQTLQNGDAIFPPMLAAIRGAKTSVNFESYIYWAGDIGKSFAEALTERARAGVKVHVLLDAVGAAKMDGAWISEMTAAGVKVFKYHPVSWYDLDRLNNRTHRKLLIVDGAIGFTGGVGIAPEWTGNAQDPDHWRDTHFKVEGPVVAQMQAVFLDNWIKVSGEVLHGDAYFPAVAAAGTERAQTFSSSPTGGSESMALMYQLAITSASRSIDLSAAYFVPDELTQRTLLAALHRGVSVRIIVPGKHIELELTRSASRALWGPLLAAGARIFEYEPTMYHCKVLIVDGLLTSVGSTNFDNRSFRLNDEASMNVLDTAFASAQTRLFEEDLLHAKGVSFEQWRTRPVREKVGDWLSSLIGSQL